MLKNKPIRVQFRMNLIFIIGASVVAALLTYALAFVLFSFSLERDIYPVNYYEQQLPKLTEYIKQESTALLDIQAKTNLEKQFLNDKMKYQVTDQQGKVLYGTEENRIFENREELLGKLNTTMTNSGYYIRIIPIMNEENGIEGSVLFFYQLKVTFANMRGKVIAAFCLLALFSPLFYMILFTFVFSRIFAKQMNEPIEILIKASERLKEEDLDFVIDYKSDNELGKLCKVFSEMKDALSSSLSAQWRMEQERVEMVEALAHDLKTPLSVIRGYTEALIDREEGENQRRTKYLHVIRENAEKGSVLVEKMQYTTELETEKAQMVLTEVNMEQFLSQKVVEYELQTEEKEIRLFSEIDCTVPDLVTIDIGKISRILDNLIMNSLRYTPKGGMIGISVKKMEDRLYYEVWDSGQGFRKKDLKYGLDKFYRGDEGRQTKGSHSGLGLYIAKQLVNQLNGGIKLENTKDGGACVQFWHEIE